MRRLLIILLATSLLVACATQNPPAPPVAVHLTQAVESAQPAAPTSLDSQVPVFEHIVIVMFENEGYSTVIANPDMPFFNQLAQENTLLTRFYAVRHPSLPNYIALIGGDTFGVDRDCTDCFINAPSLPDLIEASGRSWKTYQENIPKPCFVGDKLLSKVFKNRYAQKHNPFVYFDPIRLDKERCERTVLPFTELSTDIKAGTLPNFIFITPNMCNIGHDCSMAVTDKWLENLHNELVPALDATGQPYLVVLTFDEGKGNQSCCGLSEGEGGQIAVVLISPEAKKGFQDDTPYTHYSLLKTISASWGLTYLGHAADEDNFLITAPWK